ncbi:hypothetical protein AWZ03_004888 [Drosophila navojoa]|uniref:ADP-ribosylation factor-like protein 6-interacting protein 4 n=1 Tax=Drosophila navojoa TaxID=7232 RepID=A0A484BIT2_DRONA|nr:ADP-ribosylation factor-like protein 6-interacting protein 4 [Drosophila navojoa]TDG48776.1 hypothetical protein AWZ03_004888 [Drosophila navojoa]
MGKSEKKSKKKHKSKRKEHREKHKVKSKKSKREDKLKLKQAKEETPVVKEIALQVAADSGGEDDFAIPIALMNSKSHAPETPEEYQRRQSQIRREVDPVTGRTRLIKGDSEILEEIVSKERHCDINKKATSSDGAYFESQSFAAAKRRNAK